ncbi:g6f-like isoform X2 [Eleginops maclovinus]|uniref:g6f-like isoform X2 n=1 Tax=Eleginops maclovinus TaxID=56733 RepID=UPI0030809089
MECAFLTVIFVSFSVVCSSHYGITDWDDVVVTREGIPTILNCSDTTVRGAMTINWKVKLVGEKEWQLVLSANEKQEFSGGALKKSMHLTDPKFQDSGVFSLFLLPRFEDRGLYLCMIKQKERKLKEKIILLAILTVTVVPPAPVPRRSTLRLTAHVFPDYAVTQITWAAPSGTIMKSERKPKTSVLAKLPQMEDSDSGAYVCTVYPWGNSSNSFLAFNVNVTLHAKTEISTATKVNTPIHLTCAVTKGDYVLLYWLHPDTNKYSEIKLVYKYDRWRGSTFNRKSTILKLAGPPYNADAGSFSFLLTPGYKDGGLYVCEVFYNENSYSKNTTLTVIKVKTSISSSKLELGCLYSKSSQVRSAVWKHQNKSHKLQMSSKQPGSIFTYLPLPITSDTAGNYTCNIQLENGQTVIATQAVKLPNEDKKDVKSGSVPTPSLPPSLSALLLLVPLVAAAVGVLLWRQKHISDRGVEHSLSVISRETENIYENPEDIRQAPPQGSVYMDLKPRGENDVYKELERY